MWRLSGQHLLHERIVRPKLRRKIGKRVRQAQCFVIVVNRLGREKLQLERFLCAVAKFGNPFAIRLGAFVDHARQQPRVFK